MTVEWSKVCQWTYDDSSASWDTACKNKFQFFVDGPFDNKFRFCPYCGGLIDAPGAKNEPAISGQTDDEYGPEHGGDN